MNKMFSICSYSQYVHWTTTLARHMSIEGAQRQMANDLIARE